METETPLADELQRALSGEISWNEYWDKVDALYPCHTEEPKFPWLGLTLLIAWFVFGIVACYWVVHS